MKLIKLDNQILLLTPSWSSAMGLCWSTPMCWRLEGSGGQNAEMQRQIQKTLFFMFPDHSINYRIVLVHELCKYSEYGDNNNFVLHDDNDETVRPPVIKFHQTSCGVISQSEASDGFNISAQVEHQADVSIGMDDGASQGANDSLGGAPHLVEDEPVVVEPHQTLCGGSPGHI